MLDEIALSGRANVMVASHNEDTVKHALRRFALSRTLGKKEGAAVILVRAPSDSTVPASSPRMDELGLSPADHAVSFGQLLGMCDQISFPLGEYRTDTSLPPLMLISCASALNRHTGCPLVALFL